MEPSPRSGRSSATYGGAGGTFLRTNGWSLLLDARPDDALVGRCWDSLDATTEVDDLLATLTTAAQPTTPAFVLVRETGVRRVVARGARALVLDGDDVLAGADPDAEVDLLVPSVREIDAVLPDDSLHAPALPLRDGVVAASAIRLVVAGYRSSVVDDGPVDADASDDTQPFLGTLGAGVTRNPDESGTVTVRVRRPTASAGSTASAAPVEVPAPRVLAAVCPAGHLTPAYSGVCRVCRRTVAAQEAFETPRPPLGRLQLPGGGSVLLDRGAVLGRAPHAPRDWSGPAPHLVALADPDRDVSVQHASVVLDLWNVLVCDLGSTNGTAVVDDAGRVTRLRPYEPVALRAGGAVVLADVVTLAFAVQP